MNDAAFDERDSTPSSVEEVHQAIHAQFGALPKRLRQCARFVLDNPQRIAVSSVAELAAAAEVQPSAFVRFCKQIGFSGFSDFQRVYKDGLAKAWPTYEDRLERFREVETETGSILFDFAGAGRNSVARLLEQIDREALDRAVGLLSRAGVIHIAALRRTFPAATYLFYTFDKMQIPVNLHGMTGGILNSGSLHRGDALLAISYAPYSAETVELAKEAQSQGIAVVSITDEPTSPLARHADETLIVREIDVGSFRTLTATLVLCTSLAVGVGARRGQ